MVVMSVIMVVTRAVVTTMMAKIVMKAMELRLAMAMVMIIAMLMVMVLVILVLWVVK